MNMLDRVQSDIDTHQLLHRDAPVLVAVSGGADSVALWHILTTLGYDCVMAHCNFHLRGCESDRDEQFVRQLAEANGIPLHTIDFDTAAYAETHRLSIEMAARELRYEWFDRLRTQVHAQAVAVAHHADDHIETLLMNLLRGTGLRGMTGIPRRNGAVVRPLLGCSRQDIEHYLAERGLGYVTDSTNLTLDYTRNKLRNAVLPLLESIYPAVRQTLYADAERFDEAYTLYRRAVDGLTATLATPEPDGGIRIDIRALCRQPARRTLLYELLQPYGFSPATIAQVDGVLTAEPGKCFHAPGFRLLKDRDSLLVQPARHLNEPDTYRIDETDSPATHPVGLRWHSFDRPEDFRPSRRPERIHLDRSTVSFPLTLRHWQAGDTFRPFGMKGRKKLSDYFTDLKMSRFEKEQCWLLLSGEDIVWVVGHRTDDRFKVTDRTTRILEIELMTPSHAK